MIRSLTAGLLIAASLAYPQRPSEPDARSAIEGSRKKALDYAQSLPDFVCTEYINRFYDNSQRGRWGAADKLTIKLSFFQQMEDHKLMAVNDRPTDKTFESVGGATGVGEFGGTLHSIFDPTSQATFHWESWKTVRKHRAAVYSYVVEQAHSHYIIESGAHDNIQKALVGYHGLLEIDRDTGQVLHYTYEADRIPKVLAIDYALTTVDYDFADVGGRDYLLPAHSETVMRTPGLAVRNQMEFRDYRKFSTESTISFGDGK